MLSSSSFLLADHYQETLRDAAVRRQIRAQRARQRDARRADVRSHPLHQALEALRAIR